MGKRLNGEVQLGFQQGSALIQSRNSLRDFTSVPRLGTKVKASRKSAQEPYDAVNSKRQMTFRRIKCLILDQPFILEAGKSCSITLP